MGIHDANDAEVGFFHALLSETPFSKEGSDLAPEAAEALGVKAVSPSILEKLESEASQPVSPDSKVKEKGPTSQKSQEAAPVQGQSQPAEEAVDVGAAPATDEAPPSEGSPEPDLPSRQTYGKLFTDRRAHPLQLLDILNMRYQEDWVEWEPETTWWALRRDFGPVGEITRNKIQALRLAAVTDTPWLDWDVFENCGQAWNDFLPIFGAYQPMTPMQVAFTVHVLRGIRSDEEFAHEVKAYMAAVLDEHGWVYAPEEWFDGAQEIIDRKEWMVGLKADVSGSWRQVKDVPPEEIEWKQDDPRGVHLLKLAVVKRYLEGRESLRQQVPGAPTSTVTGSPPVP